MDCGKDKKRLFAVTNSLLGKTQSSVLPTHLSNLEVATKFADFFKNKVKLITESFSSATSPPVCDHVQNICGKVLDAFSEVSPEYIQKLVRTMPSKYSDLDEIPAWLFKECFDCLSPVVSQIMNKSISTAIVSDCFKLAHVRPLLKKPDAETEDLSNFRPVSNLSFISKLLERVVAAQLEQHISSQAKHDKFQSAYRAHHSTETALVRVRSDIMDELDQGRIVILLLLNQSAAFDIVNHNILLERMQKTYGICGKALAWFQSYLSRRKQSVYIDGVSSAEYIQTTGVPQGQSRLLNIYRQQEYLRVQSWDPNYFLCTLDPLVILFLVVVFNITYMLTMCKCICHSVQKVQVMT